MSSSSSIGDDACSDHCIWSSMSESAAFSRSAFLISSAVTYGYSPYSRKLRPSSLPRARRRTHHLDMPHMRSDAVRAAAQHSLHDARWPCDSADLE